MAIKTSLFEITNEDLVLEDKVTKMPSIKIVGRIDTVMCNLNKPLSGYISVKVCGCIEFGLEDTVSGYTTLQNREVQGCGR